MNTLPSELIAIPHYPGYFWHPVEQVVYSLKIDGVLKPLTFYKAYHSPAGYCVPAGFSLSRRGHKIRKAITVLRELKPHDYQVPYKYEIRSRV